MERRGWGAVVLVVSLILAVAVPTALGLGTRISGQGVRSPIPPPPAVGDCLLSAVEPDGSVQQYIAGNIGSAAMGACADGVGVRDHHFGEIVSVTAEQRSFPRSGGGRNSIPDPRSCRSAADDYVGWPDPTWAPVSTRTVLLLGPDGSQYSSGQRWLACAIAPAQDGYLGSIRDDRNRSAANAFAQCRLLDASGPTPIPCAQPHGIEVFATAVNPGTDEIALNGSCTSLLATVTHMSDPTASGQLEVQIGPDRSLGKRNCEVQVSGERLLHESLLGWGDEPLPLS